MVADHYSRDATADHPTSHATADHPTGDDATKALGRNTGLDHPDSTPTKALGR